MTMNMSTAVSIAVVLISAYLYLRTCARPSTIQTRLTVPPSQGYLLANKVTHARLFPVKHAFTYPTLSVLVSLDALESRELDVQVRVPFGPDLPLGLSRYLNLKPSFNLNLFRFGGTRWTLLGLRGDAYLGSGHRDTDPTNIEVGNARIREARPVSIRKRLDRVLIERGVITDASEIRDAWMMTMPAICRFEGINPLSVYFCYRHSGEVSVVVLEVHNTFGEGHVYVLQLGKNEDPCPPRGYDHQWTFPRRFFVSPFNDRLGSYTVAVKLPSQPPFDFPSTVDDAPKPSVRIHLHEPCSLTSPASSPTPTPNALTDPIRVDRANIMGPLKLIARLTPESSVPLTARNIIALLFHFPLALFITLPRILYHAWILHYLKRLPIFGRPEPITRRWHPPLGPSSIGPSNTDTSGQLQVLNQDDSERPGGIISQRPSFFERYARSRMEHFLRRRCIDPRMRIVLVPGDPSEDPWLVVGGMTDVDAPTLTIAYTSPRFFTLFLMAPSGRLFFLAGCKSATDGERPLFDISDEATFLQCFDPEKVTRLTSVDKDDGGLVEKWIERVTQEIRVFTVPGEAFSKGDLRRGEHPLTRYRMGVWISLVDLVVVCMLVCLDWGQQGLFWAFRVRFVEGTEPWGRDVWRRAGRIA